MNGLSGLEVLVVEDDASERERLAELLKREGAIVTTAANGLEALQAASTGRHEVVVTDLVMPEMDGYQLLESLHRISPRSRSVVMTAYGDVSVFLTAMDIGAVAFLPKPFKVDQFLDVVQGALRRAG